MATYTRDQFIRRVLIELTVLDANEAPEAEDHADLYDSAQQKFEELYEEGLIPFDLDGEIPARYLLSLVAVVAAENVNAYGVSHLESSLVARAAQGMRQLWKLRQRAYIPTPTAATYY